MIVGKWRVLINNLVAEATENALKKDDLRIDCFSKTSYMLPISLHPIRSGRFD